MLALGLFLTTLFFPVDAPAYAAKGAHAIKIQGVVQTTTCEALGRIDGLVLADGSYLRFHPATFVMGTQISAGDKITAEGQEILARPTRVFARLLIKRAGETVVDDVPVLQGVEAAPIMASVSTQADSKFVYRATTKVIAIGAIQGQTGDRLILEGGVTLEIPQGAVIETSDRLLSTPVSVVGAATSGSGGRYVVAMSIQDHAGTELLKSRQADSPWGLTQGVIKTLQTDAKGKIESLLLADGRSILFPVAVFPIGPVDQLAPGSSIEVSGAVHDKTIESRLMIVLNSNTVVDTDFGPTGRRPRRR